MIFKKTEQEINEERKKQGKKEFEFKEDIKKENQGE